METYNIKSSFLGEQVTYLKKTLRLGVTIGLHTYYYYGVTHNKLTRFLNAESKGKYFDRHIKGQYKLRKI